MELVKNLRYRTEAPLMDCSNALKESNGDMELAMKLLQKKGQARAMKKHGRETAHGFVVSCVADATAVGGSSAAAGAIISVCSETDFAARNSHFQKVCVAAQRHMKELIEKSKGSVLESAEAATAALQDAAKADVEAAAGVLGENVVVKGVVPVYVPARTEATTATGHPSLVLGCYTHGSVEQPSVGRLVGLVALERMGAEVAVSPDAADTVARHFVATSGEAEEGEENTKQRYKYVHQPFFGASAGENGRVETVGQWLKRNGLRLVKSVVVEFGKEPIIHTPPPMAQQQQQQQQHQQKKQK